MYQTTNAEYKIQKGDTFRQNVTILLHYTAFFLQKNRAINKYFRHRTEKRQQDAEQECCSWSSHWSVGNQLTGDLRLVAYTSL